MRTLQKKSVEKILVITLSNIGDVVMTTPVLVALHAQYPNAVIDIVGDTRSEVLLKHFPYIGAFFRKQKRATLKQTIQFIWLLRESDYDVAVDLRSDGLLHLLKAKQKCHKLPNRKSLNMHSVEKHYAAIAKLMPKTAKETIPATTIYLSSNARNVAQQWLAEKRVNNHRLLALGLGANFAGKIWPIAQFVGLAKKLNKHFDAILLLGNQQEVVLAESFITQYQQYAAANKPIVNACGKFDLLETSALLEKADYFVGNDSGLGHLASAVGLPSFTVFGVGEPHRYRPWSERALWFQDAAHEIKNVQSTPIAKLINAHLDQMPLHTKI